MGDRACPARVHHHLTARWAVGTATGEHTAGPAHTSTHRRGCPTRCAAHDPGVRGRCRRRCRCRRSPRRTGESGSLCEGFWRHMEWSVITYRMPGHKLPMLCVWSNVFRLETKGDSADLVWPFVASDWKTTCWERSAAKCLNRRRGTVTCRQGSPKNLCL